MDSKEYLEDAVWPLQILRMGSSMQECHRVLLGKGAGTGPWGAGSVEGTHINGVTVGKGGEINLSSAAVGVLCSTSLAALAWHSRHHTKALGQQPPGGPQVPGDLWTALVVCGM